jgi:DNA repair photolyase
MHVSPTPGRGAPGNPDNRFARQRYEPDADALAAAILAQEPDGEPPPSPLTQLIPDRTRSILAFNDSPDVGFTTSVNPYRGCEHGCIYCYARPTHEFLDFSAGQDFETKIMVKHDAATLLRAELSSPRWQPRVIALSGVTDCYQPAERQLRITRSCLEVLAEFRNPVAIITKSHGVTRDADLLAPLARDQAAAVYISITTLDPSLAKKMEPRASPPMRRLAAIRALADAGVPVGVLVAPILPGLTDHEGPSILEAAAAAGARFAGWVMLRLPYGVSDLFSAWLDVHFPLKKDKVLAHVRGVRGGKLNNAEFGSRMVGEGKYAEQISDLLRVRAAQLGLSTRGPELSVAAFRRAGGQQLSLW